MNCDILPPGSLVDSALERLNILREDQEATVSVLEDSMTCPAGGSRPAVNGKWHNRPIPVPEF